MQHVAREEKYVFLHCLFTFEVSCNLCLYTTTHGGRVEERGSVAGYPERSYDDEVHQVAQQERNHHQE